MFETTDDVLEHFGIKGMKWGVRRKRGADGRVGGDSSNNSSGGKKTQTEKAEVSGKTAKDLKKGDKLSVTNEKGETARAVVLQNKPHPTKEGKRNLVISKELTESEMRGAVNKMQLEKQYSQLSSEQAQKSKTRGEKFTDWAMKSALDVAASQAKRAAGKVVEKAIDDKLLAKGLIKPPKKK